MKITIAKNAGFCFGVKRAIDTVYNCIKEGHKVYTLGPIIHNAKIVDDLKKRGVQVAENIYDIPRDATVIIRSHGVSEDVLNNMAKLDFKVVDATCPFVSKIHSIVNKASADGFSILIAGDANHPEVVGIKGHCKSDTYIFSEEKELNALLNLHPDLKSRPIALVAQTTFNVSEWKICLITLKKQCTNLKIFDTICNATVNRQLEASNLAKKSDIMLIIGDKHSSNTSKLKSVCETYCPTFLVESVSDMPKIRLANISSIGVTAGASTPAIAIEEAVSKMLEESKLFLDENQDEAGNASVPESVGSAQQQDGVSGDENFKDVMEEALNNMVSGKRVKGTVVSVSQTEIFVDVGRKQSGIIPIDEFSNTPVSNLKDVAKVGDVYDLLILKTDDIAGIILLSKKRIDSLKVWKDFKDAMEAKEILTGKVKDVIKGGVIVICRGQRIFVPASLAVMFRGDSLDELKDKEVQFRIIEVNENRRHAIGSIKQVALENREKELQEFWDNMEVGKHFEGEIKSITNYGAFVNIGALDGLLHISEFSWSRVENINDIAKVGDKIDVYVKDFNKETKKISLGHKDPNADPWKTIEKDYPEGSIVEVKIKNVVSFGAFAEIIPGVEGLVHVSQISNCHVDNPKDALKTGDTVMAMITSVDLESHKISLSIRKLLEGNTLSDNKPEETTSEFGDLGENITFTSDESID